MRDTNKGIEIRKSMNRRTVLMGAAGLAAASVTASSAEVATADGSNHELVDDAVLELEGRYGVQIGVSASWLVRGADVTVVEHRPRRRFAMCSTAKVIAVGALLSSGCDLDERLEIRPSDVLSYAPITSGRKSATLADLCDAALRFSDNTAMNLILKKVGGPQSVTNFARSLGDSVTRLDRYEPELNSSEPDDPRDTSSAKVLGQTYRKILLGNALGTQQRHLLRAWMSGNTTSLKTFRTALPDFWSFADKTGSGEWGNLNDVGIVTAPAGQQLRVAVLTRGLRRGQSSDPALITDLARLIVGRARRAAPRVEASR